LRYCKLERSCCGAPAISTSEGRMVQLGTPPVSTTALDGMSQVAQVCLDSIPRNVLMPPHILFKKSSLQLCRVYHASFRPCLGSGRWKWPTNTSAQQLENWNIFSKSVLPRHIKQCADCNAPKGISPGRLLRESEPKYPTRCNRKYLTFLGFAISTETKKKQDFQHLASKSQQLYSITGIWR